MFYAMREALAVMQEEGLAAMWARHKEMHERLWLGLSELGLEPFVEADADRCVFFLLLLLFCGSVRFLGGRRRRCASVFVQNGTRAQHALNTPSLPNKQQQQTNTYKASSRSTRSRCPRASTGRPSSR